MRAILPIALVLAAVVAGAFFAPIQPMYASSDSMAPTIETGDLYFVHQDARVRTGDVISFESSAFDDLVTHRVVGQKSGGFVTKGDANPSTDQQAGHPIVSRSAVRGSVVEINGRPVTVSGVGPLAAQLAGVRQSVIALGILIVVALWARSLLGDVGTAPERSVVYVRDIVSPLFVGSVLACFLFVFWGASVHDLNYIAAAGNPTAAHTVPVGEAVTRTVTVDTVRPPFTTLVVEAKGVSVLERAATATGVELLIEVPAQSTTGLHRATVDVATYPATLPSATIEWLHGIHWLAAAVGTMAPVFGPVYLLYVGLMDGRMPVRPPSNRWLRRVGGF